MEPHGFFDEKIISRNIDAAITPVVDVKLPLAGAFLRGQTVLPTIIKRLKPLTILASTTGGNAKFSGLLGNLMKMEGSTEKAADSLDKERELIDPVPGVKYTLKTYK